MFQNKTTYAFEPYGEDKVYVIYTKMFISSLLYNRYIIPCEDILLKNSWQRCCWRCQAFLSAAVLCTCIFCRLVYTTTVLDKACMWQLCSNVQVTIGTCLHDNFYERWGTSCASNRFGRRTTTFYSDNGNILLAVEIMFKYGNIDGSFGISNHQKLLL